MAKPVQANFLLNNGKVPNLCKPNRQAETSFDKPMGEVKQLSVQQAKRTRGKLQNLCKAGRLKRVSISQWVKLKQVSVQQAKRTRGKLPNLCQPSRQAETSFNKPMGEVKTSFCSASEANKGRSLKSLPTNQAD